MVAATNHKNWIVDHLEIFLDTDIINFVIALKNIANINVGGVISLLLHLSNFLFIHFLCFFYYSKWSRKKIIIIIKYGQVNGKLLNPKIFYFLGSIHFPNIKIVGYGGSKIQ